MPARFHFPLAKLTRYVIRPFLVLCSLMVISGPSLAAEVGLGSGTLGSLGFARGGKIAHFSSHDLSGGNADMRRVEPGKTYTLVDYQGAGIVRRWWVTISPWNNTAVQRQSIIRCYWDGEEDPSVEVPVTDFFGVGFGIWTQYVSLPLEMTSGGYNCYWPMPFKRSARITLENRSPVPIDALYYNVDIETHKKLPADALYFHAQFRRQTPTVKGKPVLVLDTTGKGQYVGTMLSMQMIDKPAIWFLEGDENVRVDGEKDPSIIGTGSEDYFCSGWYFNTGPYSAPYHGCTIKDEVNGRVSAYRWHIEDAIPFEKSIRFEMEHGSTNDSRADYSSVAYWYQTHPKPKFPPLPADLMPIKAQPAPKVKGMVEGEDLVTTAKATSGNIGGQDLSPFPGTWSGDHQLWWTPDKVGERLTLTLKAPAAGDYELLGYFTKAPDYGNFNLTLNGKPLTPEVTGFNRRVKATGPITFGKVPFKEGDNELVLNVTGKEEASAGYMVGIDGFVLKS